jgi:hypothetical protein
VLGKPDVRSGGGGGVLDMGGREGAGRFWGAVKPRRVALGRDAAGAGIPAAGMGALGRARVLSSSSSEKMWVASSAKTWVASSSSSQSTSTELAGRACCTAGAGFLDGGGGPTTGGSEPRPGGGGGSLDGLEGGGGKPGAEGIADGAVTPSSVRFPTSGPRSEGGGGGTLRPEGREGAPFFPRSSKMSRSAPPFSFCAIARVS